MDFYDEISLLKLTLYELSDMLGHTLTNPISLNLLCLEFNISIEIKDKWVYKFKEV